MAAHSAPLTFHLHLRSVHTSLTVSWLAVAAAALVLALLVVAVVVSGDGTLLSPDQLPHPRNLTSIVR